jgi:methylglutaconyl-CoA hydratase
VADGIVTEGRTVTTHIQDGIAEVRFMHPRGNSLPGKLLMGIAEAITAAGKDSLARVVVIRSEGDKVFCGGASFDELASVKEEKHGHDFFMGFARVILAIQSCPLFVVARIQGKTVGGGVGLAAAADYALASDTASARLSEFALGFGPFVISAAVERKIGLAHFGAMTIDTEWRDAAWCKNAGLYAGVYPSIAELDRAIGDLTTKLAKSNPEATAQIKRVLWAGTEHWGSLLSERAGISAKLTCTDFVQAAIQAANQKSQK